MLTLTRLLQVAACAAWMSACVDDRDQSDHQVLREHAEAFIPEDAVNKVVAPGIPWIQISFDVRREPLEFAVSAERLKRAEAEGWRLCQPSTAEWAAYYDASVTPRRYTQTKAYVLYKDGVLIELIGMYHSDSEAASVRKNATPVAERVQHGVVTARKSTHKGATEAAEVFGLACR